MNWEDNKLKLHGLRIVITNKHIHAKGQWVMHVREFNWNVRPIGVVDTASQDEAQVAAVNECKIHLQTILDELNTI